MLNLITRQLRAALTLRPVFLSRNFSSVPAYQPQSANSSVPSTLERKPDSILVKQWWSQSSFDLNKPIFVPIHSFQTGDFAGENIELVHDIFNVPLRRDIVHTVYVWRSKLGKRTTHFTRTVGSTAGSGKKPMQQKGTGRARQGNKRAAGRTKGGKAHGATPRDLSYEIPRKIRLQALKIMLSAKLAEGKLRIIDTEKVEAPKTKLVAQALKGFDPKCQILLVTGYKTDENFEIAHKNIPKINVSTPHSLNIMKLLKCDKLLITKEGLTEIVQNLRDRKQLRYALGPRQNRELMPSEVKRNTVYDIKTKKSDTVEYDPSKPLKFKFKILEEYLKDYEERQKSGKQTQTKSE